MTWEQLRDWIFVGPTTELDPHRIGATLREVWKEFQKTCSEGQCLRLCTHNLLVLCSGPEYARGLAPDLEELLQSYPGLAVVAVVDPDHEGPIQGAYKVFTRRKQFAGELVAVRLGAHASPLPSMVTPLWVDGLPIVLICRGPVPYGTGWFGQIVESSTRVVIDSDSFRDAPLEERLLSLARLHELRQDPYLATHAFIDLAWARLQIWRDWVAGMFDRPDRRKLLPQIESIELECWALPGAVEPGMTGLYLGAWIVSQMGWPVPRLEAAPGGFEGMAGDVRLRFFCRTTDDTAMLGRPVRVTLRGAEFRLSVERDCNDCSTLILAGSGAGASGTGHTLHLSRMNNLTLMGRQLDTEGRDRQFERVLDTLLQMTGALQVGVV